MEIKSEEQLTAIFLMNLSKDEDFKRMTAEQCRMLAEAMVGAYVTGYKEASGKMPFKD